MAGDRCVVCGNSKAKYPNISMHRFPAGEMKRKRWIEIMGLAEGKQHSRICSRQFLEMVTQQMDLRRPWGRNLLLPKNYGAEELKELSWLSKEMLYGH